MDGSDGEDGKRHDGPGGVGKAQTARAEVTTTHEEHSCAGPTPPISL
jgi:hypothetical protein